MTDGQPSIEALLQAALNLSRHHRDHEKYYAAAPRETALQLQRHARTLQALADQWSTAEPSRRHAVSPYEGADDLNSEVGRTPIPGEYPTTSGRSAGSRSCRAFPRTPGSA
jgi:hypothetical protein